jgi:hypothetical protein
MASSSVKQPCIKCDQGFVTNMCIGCQKWFCNKHYNEHQEELTKEMDDITQKHDELHSHSTIESIDSVNPILVRINKWEQESIDRIRAVANEARTKLKQSLDKIKEETKATLSQVANELKSSPESEDYIEIDLKRWMDRLGSLKQRLLNTTEIELYGDTHDDTDASMIRLIRINIHRIVSKLMRISLLILHYLKHSSKSSVYFCL